MSFLSRWIKGRLNSVHGPRRKGAGVVANIEALEGRALLSGLYGNPARLVSGPGGMAGQVEVLRHGQNQGHGQGNLNRGLVRKAPHFYEFFIGPQRKELNVVAARAQLKPGQGLVFQGTVQGRINTNPATPADNLFYVFGVNRGSPQAITPFFNRPGISFDAVVIISISSDSGVTASVRDLTTGASTTLSPNSVRIQGRDLRVTVDPALLPTPAGGKPLDQSTFNLWPRTSLANPTPTPTQPHPSFVASFIPENSMAPIQVSRGRGH